MHRVLALVLAHVLALAAAPLLAHARPITDSAGRLVEVPDRIDRVFAAGPPASVLLYVLAPEKMTGWPSPPTSEERHFIAPAFRDLPGFARLDGRGAAEVQAVVKAKADLIVDFGSVSDAPVALANTVQRQSRLPYILVDGRFERTAAALRLTGEILGVERRADELARYVEATFGAIDAVLKITPAEMRPKVYLARGPDGLETGAVGSDYTEIIERAGGHNVIAAAGRSGLVRASIEQVVAADPEIIVTWDRNFFEQVGKDRLWAGIRAVREKRVYLAPTVPFGWIDRPLSLNRVIGLKWLACLFYPDKLQDDLRATTRDFYRLFYHVALSDAELDGLIAGSKGAAAQSAPANQ